MDVQAQPVPEAVDVTFFDSLVLTYSLVTHRLEQLTGSVLVFGRVSSQFQFRAHLVVNLLDLIVSFLYFIRSIAKTPGASKVIEKAATSLTGKDIEYDALSQLYGVGGCTGAVRYSCISANCKNCRLRIFSPSFCQPQVNQVLNIPNGERAAVSFN